MGAWLDHLVIIKKDLNQNGIFVVCLWHMFFLICVSVKIHLKERQFWKMKNNFFRNPLHHSSDVNLIFQELFSELNLGKWFSQNMWQKSTTKNAKKHHLRGSIFEKRKISHLGAIRDPGMKIAAWYGPIEPKKISFLEINSLGSLTPYWGMTHPMAPPRPPLSPLDATQTPNNAHQWKALG